MTTEDFKRKLTAILSADVVGYSRLMGEDEEGTVRTLSKYRKIIFGIIERNNGRLVDSPGDNILAEFKNRHRDLETILQNNYSMAAMKNSQVESFSEKKKLLLGAYYSNEYSLESAALMNPSMVMYTSDENDEAELCSFIIRK